jgi:hypothetical protein
MLLSPEEIKGQLRLDEDYTDEDNFLSCWGGRFRPGQKIF